MDFVVDEVVSESFNFRDKTWDTPARNGALYLKVSPVSKDVNVKELIFYGNSAVLSGYLVRATIPIVDPLTTGDSRSVAEIEREKFQEAIKLEIIDSKGRTLRTDRSTNYGRDK